MPLVQSVPKPNGCGNNFYRLDALPLANQQLQSTEGCDIEK